MSFAQKFTLYTVEKRCSYNVALETNDLGGWCVAAPHTTPQVFKQGGSMPVLGGSLGVLWGFRGGHTNIPSYHWYLKFYQNSIKKGFSLYFPYIYWYFGIIYRVVLQR